MVGLLKRAFLVLAALAAVVGVGWHLYGGQWKERYDARVAALRAAGQPTRFEDLATPPIPDEENGAKLLEQAHALLESRRKGPGSAHDLLYKTERTEEEEVALATYVDSLAPYFELLRQVPERPGWRPDLDWSAGIAMRVDYFSQLNEARSLVIARLDVDFEEKGRTERAATAATLFLALSAKCRGPYMLAHLLAEQVACEPAHVLRIVMRHPGFDAELFRKMVDPPLARSIPERGPPRAVLVQERAFGIGAVHAIADGADYGVWDGKRTLSFFEAPALYRSGTHFLDVMEKALARCDTTPEQAITVANELRAGPELKDQWFGTYGRFCSNAFRAFADAVAGRRLMRVVMALLQHRQREGKWPESLAALGEMPLDPYSGSAFLYERTEHGCKVRSAKEGTTEELEDRDLFWALEDDQLPAMAR